MTAYDGLYPNSESTTMLSNYPIKFDATELFEPNQWEESFEVIENVNQTEAGTDQITVTRYDKLSVSASFRCHSDWLKFFKQYSKKDSFVLSEYDYETEGYKTRTVRMRNFKASPIEFSERLKGTNGVWNISFDLGEF